MHSRDRYLIFVLAVQPAARFFSLFGTRSSNLLGNFAQRFYYEESLPAREKPIFSFPSRNSLSSLLRAKARRLTRRKKSRLYAARKSLGREAEEPHGFIVEKRVGTLLGTGSNPRSGRGFSFFAACARIAPDFPFLSSSGLVSSRSRSSCLRAALRDSSSPPRLLCLILTVMHFPALFTCFRPSTSVLESPREHSLVHLSSPPGS